MRVYLVTGNNKDGIKSIRNMVSASWLKNLPWNWSQPEMVMYFERIIIYVISLKSMQN